MRGDVDGDDLVHEDLGIGVAAKDGADGLGDVCRGEDGEGNLVEQGLKGVVVAAVDDGDVDGEFGQADGGAEAGETTADNDNAGGAAEGKSVFVFEECGWVGQEVCLAA
jgi:hypothetical protein